MDGKNVRRKLIRCGFLLTAFLWIIAPAAAHEFWIEPAAFRPPAGKPLDVRLMIGQDFRGDSAIYLPQAFERFVTINARGKQNVSGLPGDDPAARLTPAEAGLMFIVYQSAHYELKMEAKAFDRYLATEGLEGIRALRAQRGEQDNPAHEIYSRFAKSLIAVDGRDNGIDAARPVGLRLEIVPLTAIYRLKPNQPLEVQLLYENRPLANTQVLALSKKQSKTRRLQRTDANGRARFVLPHADVWMLSAVHMIPAPDGAAADWESFWASLTFETGTPR